MAQACARLCHQRRHLLNDVGGNGESGESSNQVEQICQDALPDAISYCSGERPHQEHNFLSFVRHRILILSLNIVVKLVIFIV